MANRYFTGEKLYLAGQLKDVGVVTTSYTLVAKVYCSYGQLVLTIPMQIDPESSSYFCEIATDNLNGYYHVKIEATDNENGTIISNDSINFNIELPCTI